MREGPADEDGPWTRFIVCPSSNPAVVVPRQVCSNCDAAREAQFPSETNPFTKNPKQDGHTVGLKCIAILENMTTVDEAHLIWRNARLLDNQRFKFTHR